ncbi:MAG: M28 family peptidase [Bacteroidales bacterium]|nr:M28 family peptidase [Bacteroidales bacterium]
MKRTLIFVFACLLASAPLRGQDLARRLASEVTFLADTLQAGRGFGDAGNQSVAFYLLRQLRDAGLRTTVQSFSEGGRGGHNIVAVTPGWFRRYIVVGAYFDGLGKLDGRIYPGADSNASGVAALLSLARRLPECCSGEVGVVFVAFDGHNANLSGSRAFLERYRREFPLSLMINLDILGSSQAPIRKSRPDYLIALGGSPYRMALENANLGPRLDLGYDYYGSRSFTDLFYRRVSDQRWFLDAGIPSVMFTSGITMDTNKPGDTAAQLDYALLERRVLLIETWLRGLL